MIDDYVDKVKELHDVGPKTVLTMNVTVDHKKNITISFVTINPK